MLLLTVNLLSCTIINKVTATDINSSAAIQTDEDYTAQQSEIENELSHC